MTHRVCRTTLVFALVSVALFGGAAARAQGQKTGDQPVDESLGAPVEEHEDELS